jgi:hypothetical protein
VLDSKAFILQPVVGAHLLASTSQPASEIIASLRQVTADAAAAPREQAAAMADRWAMAFQRMDRANPTRSA